VIPVRWPVHPKPIVGESLSSWLQRIASVYGLLVKDLLEYDLGFSELSLDALDTKPPIELIELIAARTGTSVDIVRSKTFAGFVPFLFDSLVPDREYFKHYVEDNSVLLPLGARPGRNIIDWLPWFPQKRRHEQNACRICLLSYPDAALLLHWQLTIMMSCPVHGLMLEAAYIAPGVAVHWVKKTPQKAPLVMRLLDKRSWSALTMGFVDLPGRRVHAGMWFRLLRTILDELNTPLKYVLRHRKLLMEIWATAAFHPRAGEVLWKPFEALKEDRRKAMLIAAATAINMMEQGSIFAQGADAKLFCPLPDTSEDRYSQVHKYPVIPKSLASNSWAETINALEQVIEAAKKDQTEARRLRLFLLFGRRDEESIKKVNNLLQEVGIFVT
jgi:hypothetical protein